MRTGLDRAAAHRVALLAGVLLIAANLRAPFTGLPPLLAAIRADLGLGTLAASALTTLPLLAFALVSPASAPLARAYGLERTLFGALAVIALGIGVRSAGSAGSLYLGTALIGMGIAVGNVLLPSLLKRDFPHRIAALTGAYALAMGVGAALCSALVVPLAQAGGWRPALAAFVVLPLVAMAVWAPRLGDRGAVAAPAVAARGQALWRSPLAWQVTLFLGLNSTIYYVAIGWLPTILTDAGLTPAQAGSQHGVLQLATAIPGLLLGPLIGRLRDQRLPAAGAAVCSAAALWGWAVAPQFSIVWAVLFGAGTGAGIILGLTFIGLRTAHPLQTAALSGMSQGIGYLLAALAPMAMGALHDAAGGWRTPLGLCAVLALAAAAMGVLAGRDRRIGG